MSMFLDDPVYKSQLSSSYPYFISLFLFFCPSSIGKLNLLLQSYSPIILYVSRSVISSCNSSTVLSLNAYFSKTENLS